MDIVIRICFLTCFSLATGCSKPTPRVTQEQKITIANPEASADAIISPTEAAVESFPKSAPESNSVTPIPAVTTDSPELPSVLQLVNSKFAGSEAQLEASVRFAGNVSPRLKLTVANDVALLEVPKLIPNQVDTLVVEIYEGQTLRFLAQRPKTTVEAGKENIWKIEDCAISKVPWDGESNEARCGWAIQDNL